jgi:hypothetical protein
MSVAEQGKEARSVWLSTLQELGDVASSCSDGSIVHQADDLNAPLHADVLDIKINPEYTKIALDRAADVINMCTTILRLSLITIGMYLLFV